MSQCVLRDLLRNFLEIAVQCMHAKQSQMCSVKSSKVEYNTITLKLRIEQNMKLNVYFGTNLMHCI